MTAPDSGHRRGILMVISSPSGAGKTTLARALAQNEKLEFSVSYTTRAPRTGERDGVDYKFVTDEEFTQMIDREEFAEWAVVHGRRYGTAVHTVNRALEDGKDYLFDIDYQGGAQLRRQWPAESVLCFILPPSMAELERRLAMARGELEHFGEYDYLIVNDNFETALKELTSIYIAARGARPRSAHLAIALCAEARVGPEGKHPVRND
jgi:guanylate kinase